MDIQYSLFTFDLPMTERNINAFRSAIIEWAGRENHLLHNHLNPPGNPHLPRGGFSYRYPLVQYRVHKGKAALFALNQGTDTLKDALTKHSWEIVLSGKTTHLRLADLQNRQFTLACTSHRVNYHLQNWIALNQQNYEHFTQKNTLIERIQKLQQILAANIISFAKGIGWQIPERFEVAIQQIHNQQQRNYHQTRMNAFDVQFSCPLALPPLVGLGKAVSHGFGVLHPATTKTTVSVKKTHG